MWTDRSHYQSNKKTVIFVQIGHVLQLPKKIKQLIQKIPTGKRPLGCTRFSYMKGQHTKGLIINIQNWITKWLDTAYQVRLG